MTNFYLLPRMSIFLPNAPKEEEEEEEEEEDEEMGVISTGRGDQN